MLDHIKEAINDVLPQKEGGEKQSQESLEKNKAPSSSLELLDAGLELIEVRGKEVRFVIFFIFYFFV